MSAKKTYSVHQSSEEAYLERNELITEKGMEELSKEVTKALASMTGKRKQPLWKLLKALWPGLAVKLVKLTRICRD